MSIVLRGRLVQALAAAGVLVSGPTHAQSAEPGDKVNFIVSQRFWLASWDQTLFDVRVVAPPTATTLPVVATGTLHTVSSKVVPITAFGMRYGKVIGTISAFHNTTFDSHGNTLSGVTRRRELDVSVGYQFIPGLTMSYIRKSGVTSPSNSTSTERLFGAEGSSKAAGNLVGLSANTSLSDRLSMYGNLAAGSGKFKYRQPDASTLQVSTRYVITDFGLAYRVADAAMGGAIDAVTLQLGYRNQSISIPVVKVPLLATGFTVLDGQTKGRSTTEGLVFSVGAVF